MKNLIRKEFSLCLHPAALIFMLLLPALVLAPNYPYAVTFFYMTLGVFFICTSDRENHDAVFTLSLPVSRRQMTAGRLLFACMLEMMQMLVCAGMLAIKVHWIGQTENAAGMDANIALFGEGFLLFGLFNLLFFPAWYKDVRKVGVPFIKASIAVFLYVALAICATYALPFVRDKLDTADPQFLMEKLLFVAVSALLYAAASWVAFRLSAKRFEQLDLQ